MIEKRYPLMMIWNILTFSQNYFIVVNIIQPWIMRERICSKIIDYISNETSK
jgi:hypothetical protein